jgi:hypothetical protein
MTKGEWHPDEQEYLAKLEQQCNMYYDHHNNDHIYYKGLGSKFNIPILVVSAINALTAVSLNSFVPQEYVSVLNAILSAGTGVLGSIQLYLKINERMANALRASMLMKRLALKISKELSIRPENRVTDGQAFLTDCFSEFNTAIEQGNPMEKKLHNHLAFTPTMKKEKYSFMNLMSGSPKRPFAEEEDYSIISRGKLKPPSELRAKSLWAKIHTDQTGGNSPQGSPSPLDQSESGQGEEYPSEPV